MRQSANKALTKPPGVSWGIFIRLTHELLCRAWTAKFCTEPLAATDVFDSESDNRKQGKNRWSSEAENFGSCAFELQRLPSTLPWQCPVLVSGREPAHTSMEEQRLQSPAAAVPKKAAEHPLCSLGALENSFPLTLLQTSPCAHSLRL